MAATQDDLIAALQRTIADLRQERDAALARRQAEQDERLTHRQAVSDVLQAMLASPGDPQPVFDRIVRLARRLLGVEGVVLYDYDGTLADIRAADGAETTFGLPAWQVYRAGWPRVPDRRSPTGRTLLDGTPLFIRDLTAEPGISDAVRALGYRAHGSIPLLRDGNVIGALSAGSTRAADLSASQHHRLRTFAQHAVIAITHAETVRALHEALDRQAATAEVLQVINASPGDLAPVFDAILEKALRLCGAEFGALFTWDGREARGVAMHSFPPAFEAYVTSLGPVTTLPPMVRRLIDTGQPQQMADVRDGEGYRSGHALSRALADLGGARSVLWVPLFRTGAVVGYVTIYRKEVRAFTDKQITLLESFAAQVVIAMDNARLMNEQQEALERQTATADMLQVINASPGNLPPVFEAMLERAMRLCEAAFGMLSIYDGARFHTAATRGVPAAFAEYRRHNPPDYGPDTGPARVLAGERIVHILDLRAEEAYRRGEPNRRALVDLGGARTSLLIPLRRDHQLLGFIQIYRQEVRAFSDKQIGLLRNFAGQAVVAMENARLIDEIRAARDHAESTLNDLRLAQDRLIQTEKLASLGQLTAGIAHEIKNPLNFVNNFSDLSIELLDELRDAVAPGAADPTPNAGADIDDIITTLKGNLHKIAHHGRRADSIVRAMLLHSRTGRSERRTVDVNATVEEALALAYHGARAANAGFVIALRRDFDPRAGLIDAYPQEFLRVMLNLISNGFHAAHTRAASGDGGEPVLRVRTEDAGDAVTIRIRDNGTGIPDAIREQIFEPFFTTKPAGEGTGLGLSLSHDIVVKQHGGTLTLESEVGAFTEFTVTLPRQAPAGATA